MLQEGKDRKRLEKILSSQKDVVFEAIGATEEGVNAVSNFVVPPFKCITSGNISDPSEVWLKLSTFIFLLFCHILP